MSGPVTACSTVSIGQVLWDICRFFEEYILKQLEGGVKKSKSH